MGDLHQRASQSHERNPGPLEPESPQAAGHTVEVVGVNRLRCQHQGSQGHHDDSAAAHRFSFTSIEMRGTPNCPSRWLSRSRSIGPTMFTMVSSRGSAEMTTNPVM